MKALFSSLIALAFVFNLNVFANEEHTEHTTTTETTTTDTTAHEGTEEHKDAKVAKKGKADHGKGKKDAKAHPKHK